MQYVFMLYRFIYLFLLSLIVKELSMQFFLGKFARNLKFIIAVLLASLISTAFFFFVMFISSTFFSHIILSIYFLNLFVYLGLFIVLFVGSNLVIEFPLYNFIFLKGKFEKSELISLLLLINMFAYLFAFLMGFIDPFLWM
ncbi:MAG: hypothetical protein N3E39_00480 [Candidatus Methanomethylicia archaeon]|nr:hypothetical protein [Candidatus Methanomethylicia archaeon]